MRKILAGATAIVALFALTACNTNDEPTGTVTVTVAEPAPTKTVTEAPAPAPKPTQESDEAKYVKAVNAETVLTYPADVLIDLGWTICESLDNGLPLEMVIYAGLEAGMPESDLPPIIAGAIVFLCPWNAGAVDTSYSV